MTPIEYGVTSSKVKVTVTISVKIKALKVMEYNRYILLYNYDGNFESFPYLKMSHQIV